jgi:hypothetical protein
MASSPLSTATVANSNHSMGSASASFFPRVVVIVVPPRVVVSVAAQSFEPGSDIYTSDRGIVARNSVEYGMGLKITLAKRSFSRSGRVALRVGHTKQCAAGRGDGAAAVERKPGGGTTLLAVLTVKVYFEPVVDLSRVNGVNTSPAVNRPTRQTLHLCATDDTDRLVDLRVRP